MQDRTMTHSYTCFDGFRRVASGDLSTVAPMFQRAHAQPAPGPVLLFDDATGRTMDIDTRGSAEQLLARLAHGQAAESGVRTGRGRPAASLDTDPPAADGGGDEPRGRGRPKLGVVAREVTLLPRHWDWLAAQKGGASVALRKLVEQARRADTDDSAQRHERAYHFMSALAGDLPGFEEAIRALFANDRARLEPLLAHWPADVREHALHLGFGDRPVPGAADRARPVQSPSTKKGRPAP
ncbi:MAG: DUF2239 family protein [Burkholderiaceae bacterium]|nr:DUF2239 family protein [Rhodoferax sp.]MCP5260200.1 DUF2239 family protein [Rhodoferax sp.]